MQKNGTFNIQKIGQSSLSNWYQPHKSGIKWLMTYKRSKNSKSFAMEKCAKISGMDLTMITIKL
jgi:hypothetical protein